MRLRRLIVSGWAVLWLSFASRLSYAEEDTGPPPAHDDERMNEARRQFQAGVNLLEDPDGAKYEQAYHTFRKAFELSRSPKVLGNIAFCAFHLERDGEAIDAYTAYLRDVPDVSPRERAQILKDLGTLSSTVGQLHAAVKAGPGPYTLVDTRMQTSGLPVINSYAMNDGGDIRLRVRPGRHLLKVVKPGGAESLPIETTVSSSAQVSLDFSFPIAPPVRENTNEPAPRPTSHAGPIVLGATGIVLLGAGLAAGLVAQHKTKGIEANCPDNLCPATYNLSDHRGDARTFAALADVGFAAGGAALAGGVLWYLVTPKSHAIPTTAGWAPSGGCATDGCNLQLTGRF